MKTRSALVLAAHGCRHDPSMNQRLRGIAAEIARRDLFEEVAAAFYQGEPGFGAVLDGLSASVVTVVPVMTSEGYYSDIILPQELARNRRFGELEVRQTAPVGLHRKVPAAIARRVHWLLKTKGLRAHTAAIAVIGHGTTRHRKSREATERIVRSLSHEHSLEAFAAFLDEDPLVESALDLSALENVIVVPFLISAGLHATLDIPRRMGVAPANGQSLPFATFVRRHFVVFDVPVGEYEGLAELILDLAQTPLADSTRLGAVGVQTSCVENPPHRSATIEERNSTL